ncbi:hypothetical protein BC936DRAFT_148005 [Jimgerdemannia flammicorona]|uniref:Copper type II ascorbate-dependent monooxygenase C-terminal domain-containing protein n=1 Tax=Jimgerdemannia flammicorona TaxID=994334 RepID=A0A433D3X8_9FUNG|nr:hypothetical protein BC936DRAFT_148005 [Jimgerdemannia flammicorona]
MVRIVLALHLFVYLHLWPIHNIPSVSSTAWAPGTEALTFPANVGLPFGNANDTFDPSSLVIEVHYNNDNPNVTPNLTDASGLSISYTTTKREHDSGLIAMGDPSVMGGFMPFGPSKVEKQFICPGECTAKWPWDINVFASFLHMHEYGRQIWTGVTSPSPAGGNLFVTSDLDRANFYEFTFQHISTLNRTIKRGDRLNLHCILTAYISYSYDLSTNLFPQQRANDTGVTFNLASEDEMCMDFRLYVNQTSTCGEFNKDGIAGIPIQNPVSPGTANADPIITGVIAFGTDYSNGTCVFDAAHLALVPNGTVVYQIANTPNTTNTTNTTTTTTTTKSSTNGAGSTAIMNWISAIVVATVVAMVTVV